MLPGAGRPKLPGQPSRLRPESLPESSPIWGAARAVGRAPRAQPPVTPARDAAKVAALAIAKIATTGCLSVPVQRRAGPIDAAPVGGTDLERSGRVCSAASVPTRQDEHDEGGEHAESESHGVAHLVRGLVQVEMIHVVHEVGCAEEQGRACRGPDQRRRELPHRRRVDEQTPRVRIWGRRRRLALGSMSLGTESRLS